MDSTHVLEMPEAAPPPRESAAPPDNGPRRGDLTGVGLAELRDRWPIRTVYQPMVDLRTGKVTGVEALTRGRADRHHASSVLEMFRQAAAESRVVELDWLCQCTAIDSWLAMHSERDLALFLNVEPESIGVELPSWMTLCLDALQASGNPVVVELTERGLHTNPADLLHFRDRVRARGWKLAIDDIGVAPEALAMVPLVDPDVMKLDMQLLHGAPSSATARVVNAVLAQASRTGAQIVAEGIETLEHLELAISTGADIGQGWLFGRPSPGVPGRTVRTMPPRPEADVVSARTSEPTTPWQLIAGRNDVRRARKPLLAAISKHLELQVEECGGAAVVVSSFQHADNLTPRMVRRYQRFGQHAAFVGVLGEQMAEHPAPGLRGRGVEPTDPLAQEWSVVVIAPFFSAAVIARDTGAAADSDSERQFDYLVTYDRELVIRAGQLLMRRFG